MPKRHREAFLARVVGYVKTKYKAEMRCMLPVCERMMVGVCLWPREVGVWGRGVGECIPWSECERGKM